MARNDATGLEKSRLIHRGMTGHRFKTPTAITLKVETYGLVGGFNLLTNRMVSSRALMEAHQMLAFAAEPTSMRALGEAQHVCARASQFDRSHGPSSAVKALVQTCTRAKEELGGSPVQLVAGPGRGAVPGPGQHYLATRTLGWHGLDYQPSDDGKRHFTIVSMCDYDHRKTSMARVSLSNTARYCALHGYECRLHTKNVLNGWPPAWSKVALTKHYLQAAASKDKRIFLHDGSRLPHVEKRGTGTVPDRHVAAEEWVVWLDCDSIITNASVTMDSIIDAAAQRRILPSVETGSGTGNAPSFVVSEDGVMVNTGFFAARKGDRAASVLLDVMLPGNGTAFKEHDWWE